jgi:hypothetical protein
MAAIGAPWGECSRCGFKRRLTKLCVEWTGLKVCRDTCRDPRPADTRPPRVGPEGVPVRGAAPETPVIYRAEGDKGGSDL